MRALVVDEPGKMSLHEMKDPVPGEYEALCDTLCCATCNTTDLHLIAGTIPFGAQYPGVLGHESVGRVVEVGEKVKSFRVGDLVLRPTAVFPGKTVDGIGSLWGGYSEKGLVQDIAAMRTDGVDPSLMSGFANYQNVVWPGIRPAEASMLITLAETCHYSMLMGVGEGAHVLVIGDGPVGGAFAYWARYLGADSVVVFGHHERRLAKALQFGATIAVDERKVDLRQTVADATNGRMITHLIDSVAATARFADYLALIAPGGKAGIYGVSEAKEVTVPLFSLPRPSSVVFLAQSETLGLPHVLEAVRQRKLDLKDCYDVVMPLDEYEEVFNMLRRREAYKIVVQTKAE